jgi:cyclophilin family peptidyl-prolyl cis-trans isomerase
MRPGFPLGILLLAALAAPLASQGNRPLLERILLAEDHRAASAAELEVLLGSLESRDPQVLRRGIRALGRLERPALAEPILPLLSHPLPAVRAEAAQAVAQAAQGLRGDSSFPRRHPWNALVAALGERVSREQDPAVKGILALSLGRLPYTAPQEIVQARQWLLSLAADLEGEPLVNVARGMETLVRLTVRRLPLPGEFSARLAQLARDERLSPRARRSALGALLLAQAADSLTLSAAARSDDPLLRRLAPSGGLADPSPLVRYEALRVRARGAGKPACAAALAAARDSVPMVSLLALDLLGTTCPGDSVAVALVVARLQDQASDWHPAAHALLSLARLAPDRAAAGLASAASSRAWQLRMYAARAARVLHDTTLLRRQAADSVANVREAALAALHELVGHSADSLYRAALGAGDYQLVLTAANALAGSPEREPAARALLMALDRITRERKETSRDPRVALLVRLRELGSRVLAPQLDPYLRDFDPAVADSTAALLTGWTGHPQRATPARIAPPKVSLAEIERLRGKRIRFTIAKGGAFEVEPLLDDAPVSVLRVTRLVERGYYGGLSFHRVVPNFVIQGGSPGANEYAGDALFMRDELGPLSHERGRLGISTRGRDTGDGQLFINLVDNPRLDYDYTVWGRVVAGMEVVDGILEGDLILRAELWPQAQGSAALDTAGLLRTVRVLAADSMEGRKAGTPGGARARRYLIERLQALGLKPVGERFEHPFALPGGGTGVNLLALIPGTREPARYLVLSAHYDHLGVVRGQVYNGADDNASGTAAVLATAAELLRTPPAHSVIVALFDGEEEGLLGAKAFLAQPPVARSALALDLNLDMVGHSENGELWAAGAARYPALLPTLVALRARAPVRLRLGHDRPGVAGEDDWTSASDQGPFHAAGIPFVYFGVEDHKDYHQPSDDPETLTPVFFAGAVKTILDALRTFDGVVP